MIQDSSELVTLPPSATVTAVPTDIPTQDDASGIGLAFFKAWEMDDLLGMYSLLTPQSQALVGSQPFVELYENAMTTATAQEVQTQPLGVIQFLHGLLGDITNGPIPIRLGGGIIFFDFFWCFVE